MRKSPIAILYLADDFFPFWIRAEHLQKACDLFEVVDGFHCHFLADVAIEIDVEEVNPGEPGIGLDSIL